jgi:hypothetical protein
VSSVVAELVRCIWNLLFSCHIQTGCGIAENCVLHIPGIERLEHDIGHSVSSRKVMCVEIYFLPTYSRVTWTKDGLLFAVFTSFYFSSISKRKLFPSIFILALRLHFTFGSWSPDWLKVAKISWNYSDWVGWTVSVSDLYYEDGSFESRCGHRCH